MLSWVYFGILRDSLGSLLASLGTLLGPWAALGQLLVSLGPPFLKPLGPRGRKTAAKCPKTVPKVAQETKKGAKTDPQKLTCLCLFLGPFLDSLQNSLSEGFLDALWTKKYDFDWDVCQKRCLPQVTRKNNTSQKCFKKWPQN